MINRQKTRLMAKAAVYEKSEGRNNLKLDRYAGQDAAPINRMKNFLFGLAGFLLIAFLVFLGVYFADGNRPEIENSLLLTGAVIVCGVLFALGYTFFADAVCRHQYDNIKNSLRGYYLTVRELEGFYEAPDKDEDSAFN